MTRPRKLFSYVVHHDYGLSPNPSNGYCTLAFCKFKEPTHKRRNIVEMAEKGDWVVGTSGLSSKCFGKTGHLIYAMEVTKKLNLQDYFKRFPNRAGNRVEFSDRSDMFALVSDHFYYFGKNAHPLAKRHVMHPIERGGRGYLVGFAETFIADFVRWVTQLPPGKNGDPCKAPPVEKPLRVGQQLGLAVSREVPRRIKHKC